MWMEALMVGKISILVCTFVFSIQPIQDPRVYPRSKVITGSLKWYLVEETVFVEMEQGVNYELRA